MTLILIRIVLGPETNARGVSRFLNETVVVMGKEKSKTEMTALQLLLKQRTRVYDAVREKVCLFCSSFFNQVTKKYLTNVVIFHAQVMHACFMSVPRSSGIHKSETDDDRLRQSAKKYLENMKLMCCEQFFTAWQNASSAAYEEARRQAIFNEVKLKSLLGKNELDQKVPDAMKSNPQKVSSALLAFVFVKVEAKLRILQLGIHRPKRTKQSGVNQFNAGHSIAWVIKLLEVCAQADGLTRLGEDPVICGVPLHENPNEVELQNLEAKLGLVSHYEFFRQDRRLVDAGELFD